jgi:hypothetical protein
LSIPSAIYAYSAPAPESTHLAAIPASGWATSLLYWCNPLRNSWRRTLDMTFVFLGATYYAFRYITDMRCTAAYTAILGCSIGCYGLSHYLMTRGRIWPSTYAHACVHLVGNIANMVLYNAVSQNHK